MHLRSHLATRLAAAVSVLAISACSPGVEDADQAPDDASIDLPDTSIPEAPDPDPEPEDPPEEPAPEPDADERAETAQPATRPDLSVALRLTEVATMRAPTAGAVGPDGVLYLAEREGTVHPLRDGGVGEPVVDIRSETTTDGERGLLGLAFAPDGSELYLSFTDREGGTVLEGVALPGDGSVVAGERRTLFTLAQPFSNHNGGNVAFGPDGMLYLGLGDGGGGGDPLGAGQDLRTTLGSLLRFDPSSSDPDAVPEDNPFVGRDDASPQIYAYGLRNPWRFSFDTETGRLYLADVGQNSREEINVVDFDALAGANFGWNAMEGTRTFAGTEPEDHVPPVHEYETRSDQGCAVTGGYVYRGEAIPELVGAYLYSDVCASRVSALVVEDGEVVDSAELGLDGEQVVSFAQDADGELYLLDFAGSVRRIDPA